MGRLWEATSDEVLNESRRRLTALFTDIVGSTALVDQMDPEPYRGLMHRYFDQMKHVAESHGGFVEKFVGDALVTLFGFPRLREDDALRAVRAAVAMHEELNSLNDELQTRYGTRLHARSGIATGEVVTVSDVPSEFPVIGRCLNLAARLQSSAHPDHILICPETYELVRRQVQTQPAGALSLKGISEPVQAHRVVSIRSDQPAMARPFIGRQPEFEKAFALLQALREEARGGTLLITGSPGVGKSRLVGELVARAPLGSWVVTANCVPFGESGIYAPLAQIVGDLLGVEPAPFGAPSVARIEPSFWDHDERRALATQLAAVLGADEPLGSPEEVAWAVGTLITLSARDRPLVLVLEDMHWADEPLVEVVANLTRRLMDASVMLIMTARPEFVAASSEPFVALAKTHLRLEPLSEEESRTLVETIARGWDESLIDRVVGLGAGYPLFLEQLAAALQETDGAQDSPIGSFDVPRSINSLLAARVDALPSNERHVLEAAAVIGDDFEPDVVATLSEQGELEECVLALVEKDFIKPNVESQHGYSFRHALIRSAAHDGISLKRRAQLHERYALTASAGSGLPDEVRAYHLEQAFENLLNSGVQRSEIERVGVHAAEHLAVAGERALERVDWHSAYSLVQRARAVYKKIGKVPPPSVMHAAALCIQHTQDLDEARSLATELRGLDTSATDRRYDLIRRWADAWVRHRSDPTASYARAERQAAALVTAAKELGDTRYILHFSQQLWHVRMSAGRDTSALAVIRPAYELARSVGDRDELWMLGTMTFSMINGLTPLIEAKGNAERALRQARERGQRVQEGLACTHLASIVVRMGDTATAIQLDARVREIFASTHAEVGVMHLWWSSFDVHVVTARLDIAEQDLRRASILLEEKGAVTIAASSLARLGEVLFLQGRISEAEAEFLRAQDMTTSDDADVVIHVNKGLAKVYSHQGRHAEAEHRAQAAVSVADATEGLRMQGEARLDLARVLAASGKHAEVEHLVKEAAELGRRKGDVVLMNNAATQLAALGHHDPRQRS